MNQATQTLPSVSRASVVPTTEPAPEDTATVPSGLVAGVFGSVPTWKATPLPPGQLTTGVPLLCVVADVSVSETLVDCDIDPFTSAQLVPAELLVAEYTAPRLYGLPPTPLPPVNTARMPPLGPATSRG